jgi:hypothetical protein
MVAALCFDYDLLDRGAFEPTMTVTRVVAGARSINAKKAGESVQPQLPMEYRKGVAFKVFVAHVFSRDHGATPR